MGRFGYHPARVTAYIHVRTSFELVAEALHFLAKSATPSGLTLASESPVHDGEDVGFCVTLEDDTCVFEGRGRASSIVDRGPFAANEERFEIALTALDLDERNTRMFERVLEAQRQAIPPSPAAISWPPSMVPEDYDEAGFIEPPRGSLAPPLVPQATELTPATELDPGDLEPEQDDAEDAHADDRSSQTRVVRADELLRSASLSVQPGSTSEQLPLPSELVARARSLAPALTKHAGERPTAEQVVVHALRIGLAVLETQVADDAWKLPE